MKMKTGKPEGQGIPILKGKQNKGGNSMKLTKKLATMILAMLCMICLPFIKADAEESAKAEDMILVYAQVPEDWSNPCLWAWADDGTNAFEAWPGGAMTADTNNPGWYYCYLPKAAGGNVIVNANEGGIQTSEQKTNSGNVWITVTDAETVEVKGEQQTKGELPKYEAKITIHAQVPEDWVMPCLWAWSAPDGTNAFANWPGQEMTASESGWYSCEVPAWVNSVIVNGNLGEVQTQDITVEAKDAWLTVTDADTVEISYEKPQPVVPEQNMITVHARVPEDWLMPCLWAWSAPDGTNVFANWPGQELTQDGDWYTYEIPDWVNSLIINGNLGEVQTTDITVEPKDVWVTVTGSEEFEVSYEEPADAGKPADKPAETTAPVEAASDQVQEKNSNTGLIICVVIVIVAAGGGIGYAVYRKNKRS